MLKRCSFDKRRGPLGVATSYWRWFIDQDTSVGYRLYTCVDCSIELLGQIAASQVLNDMPDAEPNCHKCGASWSDGDPTVFAYAYAPKQDRFDYQIPLCAECLDPWVERIRHNGTLLTERSQSARASETTPWSSLVPSR